ncbi:MAG: hypothetical protein GWP67_05185 [Gammaproteobacteria bacterium]|jgi:DNA/RNA endonuclease YhcR with UshA esterase domain|nr:hypothetical protein [Gammaproteobacteria bacterium]
MRSFIVMAMFAASLAQAGWSDYEEVRDLEIDVDNVSRLSIKAGAGSMDVTGVPGLDNISVKAIIVVPNTSNEKAIKVIASKMNLSLQQEGGEARLDAWFDGGIMGSDAYIAIDVRVPQGLSVSIDDGSGSIDVIDVAGDVTIDDGSGSIDVENVANLKIDDGSGSIDVENASGDVWIVDGSGSISIVHVAGSVTIDDGSGSIKVSDVEKDLIIVDDGSGGLSISDVRGSVDQET